MAQLQLAAHLGHASAVFAEDDHLGDFAILTKDLRSETSDSAQWKRQQQGRHSAAKAAVTSLISSSSNVFGI